MSRRRNFFDQPVKNDIRTYVNIINIAISQGEDYATSCLLNQPYFIEINLLIAIDLNKQQALDADPKAT